MVDAMTLDPHNLRRFIEAQEGVYEQALAEIRAGRKRSHWMWFIFPQIAGLGFSPTSQHFAIRDRAEAEAYLAHPILGSRLTECCEALLALKTNSASDVFGHPDDLKLKSSTTLFALMSREESVFHRVLQRFFRGETDPRTVQLMGGLPSK